MPRLLVTKEGRDIVCIREGDCGMCIQGRGKTVLEAIGSWCLYSGAIEAVCDPPKLLKKAFSVNERAAPKRD